MLKRMRKSPFQEGSAGVILHTAHHKVGTSWFKNVLGAIAEEYGYLFVRENYDNLPRQRPIIIFQNRPLLDMNLLSDYRGSHMIRDPRDIVISGYYYHLWTQERWAVTPIRDLPANMEDKWPLLPIKKISDMSYQEYLKSLPREEGILAEMRRVSTTILKDIIEWNYRDPNIFEIKYEDIMTSEESIFREMFKHYRFKEDAVNKGCEIAMKYSFRNRSNRDVGEIESKSHLRSGRLQQWKDEFTEDHKEHFKKLHGQDLINLGYEKNMDW